MDLEVLLKNITDAAALCACLALDAYAAQREKGHEPGDYDQQETDVKQAHIKDRAIHHRADRAHQKDQKNKDASWRHFAFAFDFAAA